MALLGVLSATPVGDELQSTPPQVRSDSAILRFSLAAAHANLLQETAERLQASSLAVRCLTALLLQSLLEPEPGNPLASRYILKSREKPTAFVKTKYHCRSLPFLFTP